MDDTKRMYRAIWKREARGQIRRGIEKAGPVKINPVTLYPNILAELDASGWSLDSFCRHAHVTLEIMWSVLEDGEQMTGSEMHGLARALECKLFYLCAPTLQVIDPESNRGKRRRARLGRLLEQVQPFSGDDWYINHLKRTRDQAAAVFDAMRNGKAVTYAAWRWAMRECAYVLDCQHWAANKPRAARLST